MPPGSRPAASRLIAPEELSPEIAERYDQLISLRAIRVPVSHLLGEREFYGRRFRVSRDVLDPRPETETLIEAALSEPFDHVLDLGVGSGCILITLLAERTSASGVGRGSERIRLPASQRQCGAASGAGRVEMQCARTGLRILKGKFDLIVSNPPYISLTEMQDLSPEVREHEPRMALTDEGDGLGAYRHIAASCAGFSDARRAHSG